MFNVVYMVMYRHMNACLFGEGTPQTSSLCELLGHYQSWCLIVMSWSFSTYGVSQKGPELFYINFCLMHGKLSSETLRQTFIFLKMLLVKDLVMDPGR